MRVNISYAVDLDDLLSEASHLIRMALVKMEDAYSNITRATKDVGGAGTDLMQVVREIDKNRQKLALADNQLADYAAILAGYQQATAEIYLAEQEREKQTRNESLSEDLIIEEGVKNGER